MSSDEILRFEQLETRLTKHLSAVSKSTINKAIHKVILGSVATLVILGISMSILYNRHEKEISTNTQSITSILNSGAEFIARNVTAVAIDKYKINVDKDITRIDNDIINLENKVDNKADGYTSTLTLILTELKRIKNN